MLQLGEELPRLVGGPRMMEAQHQVERRIGGNENEGDCRGFRTGTQSQ